MRHLPATAVLLLACAGCVEPMPFMHGPIDVTLTRGLRGYRASYYKGNTELEGDALVTAMADDAEAHAAARSARRAHIAANVMLYGGLALAGTALSANSLFILGSSSAKADQARDIQVVGALLAVGFFGIFGLGFPAVAVGNAASRKMEEAVVLYNRHALVLEPEK
jgi:hypothetical protein